MSYEQLREQCAAVLDGMVEQAITDIEPSSLISYFRTKAAEVRTLPLPEVKQLQAPKEWANYDTTYVVNFIRETSHFDAPLIGEMLNFAIQSAKTTLPEVMNDAAALQKENEQLQSKIQKIQKLLSDDGYAISFQSLGQYRTALIKALKGGAA